MNDPLRPAEGVILGLALGFTLWVIALGIAYIIVGR